MAYPTIFINGTCDFTTPKLVTMEYDHFVEHIYFNKDSRVSKHPFLKFFLYNLGLRMKALKQRSFFSCSTVARCTFNNSGTPCKS